jgi:hypothetical protein
MTNEEIYLRSAEGSKTVLMSGHFYKVTHTNGLEGQNAYMIFAHALGKIYTIELIQYPNLTWAYHIEDREDNLICDSRITETYYPSFYQVQQIALQKILEYRKKELSLPMS